MLSETKSRFTGIKYVAFLRAINVGGNRLVKMEDLKKIFESLKLKNVKTFIQSGNVIFESTEKNPEVLREKIEKLLYKSLGFEVITLLRTNNEIDGIIKNNSFSKVKLSNDLALYVAFLSRKPEKILADSLMLLNNDIENFHIRNCEVYCLIKKNIKTQFSNNWLEKKLKLQATSRNITTVNKIKIILDSSDTKESK